MEKITTDEEPDLSVLIYALGELLAAAIEYVSYKHSGDPNSEDARTMGEMALDDLNNEGKLNEYRLLLDRCIAAQLKKQERLIRRGNNEP